MACACLTSGCGSGVHGAELAHLYGHKVVGVDLSEASIEKAKTRLAEAYVADVTQPERYPFQGSQRFDVVVFSDMLEHLTDPLDILTRHFQLLAPGGQVLISLPNVAIWNVRLELLLGLFEYGDTGTLDRTHMRFFTRRSFRRFLRPAWPYRQPQPHHARDTAAVRPADQKSVRLGIARRPAKLTRRPSWIRGRIVLTCVGSIPWNGGSAVCGPRCWHSSS